MVGPGRSSSLCSFDACGAPYWYALEEFLYARGNLEAARDRKGGGMRRGPFDCRNISLSRTQPVGICVHREVTVHHSCAMLPQNPELQ